MNNRLKIIFQFISRNQSKFVILLLTVAVLDYIAKFPYFSTFLLFPYPWNSIIIVWVVTAVLFRPDERFSFGTALVLLCTILVLSVFGKGTLVEALGNGVYYLLLLGFIQTAVRHVSSHRV